MTRTPEPEEIFGSQGMTREDREYRGSRFSDVKAAIFANPYQQVWGGAGEPELPRYRVTNRSVYAGILPGGRPPRFRLASIRALDSPADLRWGDDGRGFRRLVRPHGVCVTGTWEIDGESPYSGYFANGSRGLVIARISRAVTKTLRGARNSYGMALKLYPTDDPDHTEPLETANVYLADDLGGGTARHVTAVGLTNAPQVTGFNRGTQIPVLIREAVVFLLIDKAPSKRQVYPIAELGKAATESTRAPDFLRLQAAPDQPRIDADDVRDEVLAHIFDRGDPTPRRRLVFEVSVSDRGKRSGVAFLPRGQRQKIVDWQKIGRVVLDDGVASYNGDFVVHFRHPPWRTERNDPDSAMRKGGRKVRWF